MIPFFQSTGVASCCHAMLHTLVTCGITEPADFNSSGWMLSTPAAFPFYSCLTATLTSSSEIESVFTGSCRTGSVLATFSLVRHVFEQIFHLSSLLAGSAFVDL